MKPSLPAYLRREVDTLASRVNGPILLVVTGLQAYRGNWDAGCTTIGPEHELRVKDLLGDIPARYRTLSLCINSFGGSSLSAYNICRMLRSRFRRIVAYVPHVAASAGTLLGLCADRIYISRCGY